MKNNTKQEKEIVMHDLLYVAIGMIILLIVIFIISLLAKERMVEESEVKDVFIRK